MNYKEASSVARKMKRFFEAFARLEEMLLAAADAETARAESQKKLTALKVQIADAESMLDTLLLDYDARKSGFEEKLQKLADDHAAALVANQVYTKSVNAEFAEAKRMRKYAHEAEVKALDLVLSEKRKRLAEIEADLASAEEAYEELKQKFTG
jgi:hypothetical protein